ncbi:alkaline phosphatase [Anaeromicropila populeti]|nr:alkaline phosphatase [Anaeromicropila populeti]
MNKKVCSIFLVAALALTTFAGIQSVRADKIEASAKMQGTVQSESTTGTESEEKNTIPKYIFLFIGDGMSYPQIQSASYYLGATQSDGKVETKELSFMQFPVAGSAQTYDSTSFCPDSASTATSISTGYKTYSGTINMDTTMTISYETIAEKLKKQLGYKIGVLSTVNLNHATPAAFYAHQASRNNYYEIGLELVKSNFDYFAGGALKQTTGADGDQTDLYKLAERAGYTVIRNQGAANALEAKDGKAIVIHDNLADSDAMPYAMDADENEMQIADYVEKGIEVLKNDTGFFMMVEGGKIDWACHANDAASSIHDTLALNDAIEKAIKFYKQYPEDTLILVTGDHETGGLTIGYAGTNYDTYLTNLENQKISYAKFDSDYVSKYKKDFTDFSFVLEDIEENFGLAVEGENQTLVLTDYEYKLLENAYNRTLDCGMKSQKDMTQREYELYGSYEPLTVTITHILNKKSGISFSSYSHTGIPVPVFAQGAGAEEFQGYYDNTDIFKKLAGLTQVK